MTRSKKDRINKDHSKVANSSTRTRKLIECKCTLRCHGSKFVDPRTFENHQQEMERFRNIASRNRNSFRSTSTKNNPIDVGSTSISKGKEKVNPTEQDYNSSCNSSNDDDELISVYQEPIDVPRKQKRYAKFFDADGTVSDHDESETVLIPSDDEEGFEIPVNDEESSTEEDDCNLSEEDISVEQFTAPDFDEFEVESDDGYPDRNINFDDLWILLWILKYQARFRLSDVAIDSLIKFFRMVLLDVNHSRFRDFPTTLYMTRKLLGLGKQDKAYAVCPDCNTLYKVSEILQQNTEYKCTHVEFPNHPRQNRRQPCGTQLMKWIPIVKGYI